jgi:UDP-N-acetylmuramoyl-tripeptide--D-alanyl-D-alanine ligase
VGKAQPAFYKNFSGYTALSLLYIVNYMNLILSEIPHILGQPLILEDQAIQNIVIDSRLVKPGDIFVAIKGEQFDGHDFVQQAQSSGAIAVIVEKMVAGLSIPVLQVSSTVEALAQIAHAYRLRFDIPFIGVTGSCGKTSTKALIASVLAQSGKTLATEGTLNNHLGVPLTLFRLNEDFQYAVIEMGANHPGEINALAKIVEPTVGIITNAGPVHLEGFGSVEGVQKAKGEMYENLMPEGVGIVNVDDDGAAYWLRLLQGKRIISFGLAHQADVMAENIRLNDQLQPSFDLKIYDKKIPINLPLIGVHQVSNALVAAAVGYSQGLSLEQIQKGLESAPKTEKRGILQTGYNGVWIIDDSYNANPKAFTVAVDMLMAAPNITSHILVMGDMGELGSMAAELHADVGKMAKEKGVSALYSVGKLSQAASAAFGENAFHFPDQASLVVALKDIASSEKCFLVKGSKSSHMGDVVMKLLEC